MAERERPCKIDVVAYNPRWPCVFEEQKLRIATALKELALCIDHVGSTAVPGLPAKPVIDIHLTVPDSADEAAYGPALEKVAFELVVREPEWFEHRMYRAIDPDVNLHVFSAGCPELDRCRLFRDWMRISEADRVSYCAMKQALTKHDWQSVDDYAAAKGDVIARIMARASEWAQSANAVRAPSGLSWIRGVDAAQ
jgi:GrpB-like predicted nucleotidyltransferase (UPF0157 family)